MPAAAGTSTWVGVGPVAAAVCSASLTFQMCWLRLRHPRRQSTLFAAIAIYSFKLKAAANVSGRVICVCM